MLVLLLCVGNPLAQATESWSNGSGDQLWTTGSNWSGNALPTASDAVFINTTGSGNVTTGYPMLTTGSQNGADIYIGSFSGHPSRLDVTGGSLTSNSTNTSNTAGSFVVAPDATSLGILNLANSGTSGGTLTGFGLGSGNLFTNGIFLVGRSAGANGIVNINTTDTLAVGTVTNAELQVGVSGTGTLNLDAGTVSSYSSFVIGDNSGSVGTVNVSGGAINAATTQAGKPLILGVNAGSQGTLNVSGGAVNVTAGQEFIVGLSGTATFTISGGNLTATHPTEGVRLAFTAGTGTANLNGGTILTTLVSQGSGSGTFNFNGGVLQSGSSNANFMTGLTVVNVRNGGAKIDTNNNSITIAQPLLHSTIGGDATTDGGLLKSGSGTLTLAGINTYNGGTIVNFGTLATSGSGTLGTGNVTLTNTSGVVLTLGSAVSFGDTATLRFGAATTISIGFSGNDVLGGITNGTTAITSSTYTVSQLDSFFSVSSFVDSFGGTGKLVVISPVPEPSTWTMMAGGIGMLLAFRRRRRGGKV